MSTNTTKLSLDILDDSELEFGDWINTFQAIYNADMALIDTAAGNGSVGQLPYAGKSANYTVTATDCVVDITANTVTVNFPSTIDNGKAYMVTNNTGITACLAAVGTTINGAANVSLTAGSSKLVFKATSFKAI